jgi:hypothetical protein
MGLPVQLAIRRSCDDVMLDLPGGAQAPRLPETCRLDLDPVLIEQTARKLASRPGLDHDLTRLVVDIDQKLGTFTRGLQGARRLRARLEASA